MTLLCDCERLTSHVLAGLAGLATATVIDSKMDGLCHSCRGLNGDEEDDAEGDEQQMDSTLVSASVEGEGTEADGAGECPARSRRAAAASKAKQGLRRTVDLAKAGVNKTKGKMSDVKDKMSGLDRLKKWWLSDEDDDAAELLQEALGEQVCKDLEKQHEGVSLRTALNEVLLADIPDSIPVFNCAKDFFDSTQLTEQAPALVYPDI